jgi:hypothetical protein
VPGPALCLGAVAARNTVFMTRTALKNQKFMIAKFLKNKALI